jgi:hypothetical protein
MGWSWLSAITRRREGAARAAAAGDVRRAVIGVAAACVLLACAPGAWATPFISAERWVAANAGGEPGERIEALGLGAFDRTLEYRHTNASGVYTATASQRSSIAGGTVTLAGVLAGDITGAGNNGEAHAQAGVDARFVLTEPSTPWSFGASAVMMQEWGTANFVLLLTQVAPTPRTVEMRQWRAWALTNGGASASGALPAGEYRVVLAVSNAAEAWTASYRTRLTYDSWFVVPSPGGVTVVLAGLCVAARRRRAS